MKILGKFVCKVRLMGGLFPERDWRLGVASVIIDSASTNGVCFMIRGLGLEGHPDCSVLLASVHGGRIEDARYHDVPGSGR